MRQAWTGSEGSTDHLSSEVVIRQLIQTSPAKANELFAKLAETSGNAVKTRERLFSELKEELELQMRLEEQHLFPVLRKRIRPALTRGNRHIPLQDRHRSWPARPDLPAQKTEARVGCSVLNRMTRLGMPVSQRIA